MILEINEGHSFKLTSHSVERSSKVNDFVLFCECKINKAGQVRKLVCKSANPQLRTNEKSCGLADFGSLNCGLAVADYF